MKIKRKQVLFTTIILATAGIIFAACTQASEPTDIAKVFLNAVEKQNIKKMGQYLATRQEAQAHIIQDENFVKMMCGSIGRELDEKGKVKNMIALVDGDTATVIISLEQGTMQLGMFKEADGKWKIDVAFE
ncbi:MAG: hypothetical protein LBG57_05335 [Treponema sp.]|jgi:hypothetical protein|nr:hypothetical protein [Treponema sp.]